MHCLSSVYFVNQPVRVSGVFIAHHQEVSPYVYRTSGTNCSVVLTGLGSNPVRTTDSQLKRTISINSCIHTVYLLMMGYKYDRNMYRLTDEIY